MSIFERLRFGLGVTEYVVLRLVRRFAVPDRVLRRFGGLVPYYRTNANEVDAAPVIALYEGTLAQAGRSLPDAPVILEIGSGATNAVGYALARHRMAGPRGRVVLFEPFAPLDEPADRRHREGLGADVLERVQRTATLQSVASGSVDLVLSHSVLEHVRDPGSTFRELRRVLAPTGLMVHAVDYRDHFFKYPYHFLLFSRRAWDAWLDPGDLPRWRLGDHVRQLAGAGFRVDVVDARRCDEDFARVAARIHPDFDRDEVTLPVAQATLVVTPGS